MGQACGHSLLCRNHQYQNQYQNTELRGQQVFLRADDTPVLHSLQGIRSSRFLRDHVEVFRMDLLKVVMLFSAVLFSLMFGAVLLGHMSSLDLTVR
ncbi:cGMP-dependent 3',5'-cyclic phosphodiesterase isoform PDE2A3 [Pimephales promelas]|nr:cGMP-dependent 3',5'-cyclic phosphodiesterase isoform PDE2A3 [Pimephales promelas]